MPYVNNKGADQPAQKRSLISAFVVRCLDSMICVLAIAKVSRFYLGSVADQSALNLTWSKIPEDTFLQLFILKQNCLLLFYLFILFSSLCIYILH